MTTARYASTLLFSLFIFLIACQSSNEEFKDLTSLEGGKTFAVPSGTVADQFVLQRFPDARFAYFNSVYDCALAVTAGKADAAVYDLPVLKNIAGKDPGLNVINEILVPDHYGFAVAKGETTLKLAIDETLQSLREGGLYDEMLKRWLPEDGPPGEMPEITVAEEGEPLIFGTAAVTEPMAFVRTGGEITGFDIEFAMRIAARLKRPLKVVNMEFGAMLPALISGKVDMIGAGLSITEERAKQVLFSESYYAGGLAALVKASSPSASVTEETREENQALPQHIAVLLGSIHEHYARDHYPESQVHTFNAVPDMLTALQSEKVDAVFVDHPSIKEIFSQHPGFRVLEANIYTVDIAAGFHPENAGLATDFNLFLKEIRNSEVYEEIRQRWMEEKDASFPLLPEADGNPPLRIGVVSDIGLPFASRNGNLWKGFDIELTQRFGLFLGRRIAYVDMPFGSLMPALLSGKIDMIAASVAITEERASQILFSDPYYAVGVSLIGNGSLRSKNGKMTVLDDMQGRRVGVLTGTVHDTWLQEHHPQAIVMRFSNIPDMILSLQSGKADAIMLDRSTAILLLGKNGQLGLLSDDVLELPLGIGFHKQNPVLRETFNQYLAFIRDNGQYDTLYHKWFEEDAEMAEMPVFAFPDEGEVLNVGVSVNDLPYVAVKEGRYVGFDIELISGFAAFAGYTPRYHTLEFSSLIAALSSGKVDMIADGMAITEERAEKIAFSDEYVRFRTAVIAKKADLAAFAAIGDTEDPVGSGFWASLVDGVERNLLKEKRYLMILKGLWVTLLITILAALSGTLLGGGVCYMRMSEKKWLRNPARSFISLIRGTPVLVLLMIIYYVIFSSVNINAVLVAVIAFGINFAAYVSEMFRSGIESVDHGQKEAGIASGFSPVQTFIHIIAPQALRRILPVYKGEFISLLKMTSVVGYIAVEDLTKASDIIRSRTFDAFFPLLLAAAIYIVLAWALTLMLDRLEISVNPLKRTQKRLKKAAV